MGEAAAAVVVVEEHRSRAPGGDLEIENPDVM